MRIEKISIDLFDPNPWNPNQMDDDTFNILAEELNEDAGGPGYIDLVQVFPMESGRFQIIGGEHRWRAMRALGNEEMDAVVLDDVKWKDEDFRKFVTMRLNALHGKLNPEKFVALYQDLASRHDADALQRLMAFTDKDAWNAMTADIKKSAMAALDGASDEVKKKALEKIEKASKEVKTVEGLSQILNNIFNEYGSTLDRNFIVFSFGGKKHAHVSVTAPTWKTVQALLSNIDKNAMDADVVFGHLLGQWPKLFASPAGEEP